MARTGFWRLYLRVLLVWGIPLEIWNVIDPLFGTRRGALLTAVPFALAHSLLGTGIYRLITSGVGDPKEGPNEKDKGT